MGRPWSGSRRRLAGLGLLSAAKRVTLRAAKSVAARLRMCRFVSLYVAHCRTRSPFAISIL